MSFIDKMLAREESHQLVDYRKCLRQIDRVLRQRNPCEEPGDGSRRPSTSSSTTRWPAAVDVPGWDYARSTAARGSSCTCSGATPTPAPSRTRSTAGMPVRRLGLPRGETSASRLTGACRRGRARVEHFDWAHGLVYAAAAIPSITAETRPDDGTAGPVRCGDRSAAARAARRSAHTLARRRQVGAGPGEGPLFRPQRDDPFGLSSDYKRDELFATGPEKRITIAGLANTGRRSFYTSHVEPDLNDEPHVYRERQRRRLRHHRGLHRQASAAARSSTAACRFASARATSRCRPSMQDRTLPDDPDGDVEARGARLADQLRRARAVLRARPRS